MNASKGKRRAGLLVGLGIFACALCCSVPLLVGIGVGGAALLAFGAVAEKIGIALVGLGVIAFVWNIVRQRRKSIAEGASCSIDCRKDRGAGPRLGETT